LLIAVSLVMRKPSFWQRFARRAGLQNLGE
jgi:hypothetical protein